MAVADRIEGLQRRVERERERYPERSRIFRIAWVLAGVIVTLGGAAMVLLPGPAFVVIPVGLAMLSLQFAWAQVLLDRGLSTGHALADRAAGATLHERVIGGAALACAVGCFVALTLIVLA